MAEALRKQPGLYTYKDYLTWPEHERWEIIDGISYMSAAPSTRHQEILGEIFRQISNYLLEKPCKVFSAPFDVLLPHTDEKEDDIKNVVQPDIVIVCDKAKLDERGYKGSPNLIIEVVSPSTASVDYIKKLALYEKNHVAEYWIVHPTDEIIMVFKLKNDGLYGKAEIFSKEHNYVKVGIFDELQISLGTVFGE